MLHKLTSPHFQTVIMQWILSLVSLWSEHDLDQCLTDHYFLLKSGLVIRLSKQMLFSEDPEALMRMDLCNALSGISSSATLSIFLTFGSGAERWDGSWDPLALFEDFLLLNLEKFLVKKRKKLKSTKKQIIILKHY